MRRKRTLPPGISKAEFEWTPAPRQPSTAGRGAVPDPGPAKRLSFQEAKRLRDSACFKETREKRAKRIARQRNIPFLQALEITNQYYDNLHLAFDLAERELRRLKKGIPK